jgi:hypothetical protein
MRRWLARLVDDERLKPRELRERHPIAEDPPVDIAAELFRLKCQTARLWDAVWWLSLPWYRRLAFRLLGFHAPIRRFYLRPGEEWR